VFCRQKDLIQNAKNSCIVIVDGAQGAVNYAAHKVSAPMDVWKSSTVVYIPFLLHGNGVLRLTITDMALPSVCIEPQSPESMSVTGH
jgi:hypothetical protein